MTEQPVSDPDVSIDPAVPAGPARDRVARQIAQDPSIGYLRFRFTEISEDGVAIRMPVEPGMRNAFGMTQGGFAFLLGDAVFAFTATASGVPMVTHHANVTYTAPACGDELTARGRILHRYGRHAVVEVVVLDGEGSLACIMTVHGVASRESKASSADA